MKTRKRQPINDGSFVGFDRSKNTTNIGISSDLVKFLITLIEMDKQRNDQPENDQGCEG